MSAPVAVSPARLAGLIADEAGTDRPGVRVGIDGPVHADAHRLADDVTAAFDERAVPVARVCAEDFLRARSVRLEHGADDPDTFSEGWYDLSALRREVLDPMGPQPPGGSRWWLPRLRDPVSDRPYREQRRVASRTTVVVLDGLFLARWELADAIDVLIHLDVSRAARSRRVPGPEQARLLPAWQRYLDWYRPAANAALVVRYDQPRRPAVSARCRRRPG